jgi:dCMP deaminase
MDETLLLIANVMAQRGTCSRARVGVIFARDGRALVSGYNGSPHGMPHCLHPPQERSELSDPSEPSCEWAVHAEANAIAFAARYGVALDGSALYATHTPCVRCAQLIINAGVTQVIASTMYRVRDGVNLLQNAGVIVLFWDTTLNAAVTVPTQ